MSLRRYAILQGMLHELIVSKLVSKAVASL